MSRRSNQTFNCEPLSDLTRQLLMSPRDKRVQQVRRAERLHDDIDPEATYPLDYIVYRITRYRRGSQDNVLLVGQAVSPDLRLIIDSLSRSVEIPLTADEPVETIDDLARRLRVSTKTIGRWRRIGLRWRWVVSGQNGKKQISFTRDAVDRFVAQQAGLVQKASAFSKIGPADRQRLIDQARRILGSNDLSLNQVASPLARLSGRALETIRLLLEHHDRDHPQQKLFVQHRRPLSPKQKRLIARAKRRGISLGKIAEHFGRSRTTIHRAINELRAADARRLKLSHVGSRTFDRADADQVILRPEPEAARSDLKAEVAVDDLPEPLRRLYSAPLIKEKRQRSLFIRYNYLKYKAGTIRDALGPYKPRSGDLDRFEAAVEQARSLRDLLVRANLPIGLSVVKRHLVGQPDQSTHQLLEVANGALFEAVESYDASRNQRFESFLTNRLMRALASDDRFKDTERRRAQRRLSPDQVLQRMIEQARGAGVELI